MKCNECQMDNIEGALFCEECGAKLEGQAGLIASAEETDNAQLVLTSAEGNRLEIPAKDEVIVGREDPISDIFPDLDLTDLGGMDKGVSRKHAVIHRSGSDYTVEDMGSTNGTFVNKKKIAPYAPQAIKPGDEVRFGKLALSVQAA